MWKFITDNFVMNSDGFGVSWSVATFLIIFAWIAVARYKIKVTKSKQE